MSRRDDQPTRPTRGAAIVAPPPAPGAPGLCVLHVDPDYVVIVKPPGVRAVPGRGDDASDSIETRLRAALPDADGPLTVHRLDIETSGVMVYARNRDAHRSLSRRFMQRKVSKTYVAVLDGRVDDDEGAIDLPLLVDWENRPLQKVDHEDGKPARTLYRVTERRDDGTTLVEFRPETGRTHQLRVHAATARDAGGLGCPIQGDTLYGDPTTAPRLMLHANFLGFWGSGERGWLKFRCDDPAFDAS